jgi:hypothetical protein
VVTDHLATIDMTSTTSHMDCQHGQRNNFASDSFSGALLTIIVLCADVAHCATRESDVVRFSTLVPALKTDPGLESCYHLITLRHSPLSARLLASACSSLPSETAMPRCWHFGPDRLLPCRDTHYADAFQDVYAHIQESAASKLHVPKSGPIATSLTLSRERCKLND